MELKVNIDYDQIMNLIQLLPSHDLEKLSSALLAGLNHKKEIAKSRLVDLILSSPTLSYEEYSDFAEARAQINKTGQAN
jgi:hypothetical protein